MKRGATRLGIDSEAVPKLAGPLHLVGNRLLLPPGGIAGVAGTPTLVGTGTLLGGTPVSVTLTNAPANAAMLAWVSFAPVPFAAIGRTVHAYPFANQLLLFSDPVGSFTALTNWPLGIQAGTEVTFQFLVQDLSSIHGITLSNGLLAVTP